MKTPYFMIKENELSKNISQFKEALKKEWSNSQLSYSVKTNSLPWLLNYMNENDVMAEVVSDEEYLLARKCGYNDDRIVFNGPIKGNEILVEAINGGAFVNIDSKNDINVIKKSDILPNSKLGVRVNLNPEYFNPEDIGYEEDGFRFGFSYESGELKEVIEIIKKHNSNFGLHLHCNSVTRSIEVYRCIARYVSKIIEKYKLKPQYIDIGGGFFGGVPNKPTAIDYIKAIKEEFQEVVNIDKTKLIIEPGSAIIGSVVDLYTSVIDVKDTYKSRIVTTDGSRIHIDPLWIKKGYMYSIKSKGDIYSHKQIICGYTCMDHDRLMSIENEPELSIGDKIIYHRVGAYSMTFGGPFIRYFPDVYVERENSIKKVRERFGIEDYYRMHSINDWK